MKSIQNLIWSNKIIKAHAVKYNNDCVDALPFLISCDYCFSFKKKFLFLHRLVLNFWVRTTEKWFHLMYKMRNLRSAIEGKKKEAKQSRKRFICFRKENSFPTKWVIRIYLYFLLFIWREYVFHVWIEIDNK